MPVALAAGGLALAAAPAGAQEDPEAVELSREIVYSNPEVLAMGGAGLAFASGGGGLVLSPAAPANRRTESVAPVTGTIILRHTLFSERSDPGNLGEAFAGEVRWFDVGGGLGYRDGAGAVLAAGSYYKLGDTWVGAIEGHAAAAVALAGGRLHVGAGPRLLAMRVAVDGGHDDWFGAGVEAGAQVVRWHEAWNLGLTVRSGVTAGPLGADGGGSARLPPGVLVGLGWSNLAALSESGGGLPVRLAADLAVDAPLAGTSSLEQALEGELVPRGDWFTLSPRAGAEVDVWPDRLRLRAGTYLEPSRTPLAGPRPHATGGFELRLFHLAVLHERIRLNLAWQVAADWAPRYFRGAWLGINVWNDGLVGGRATPAGEPPPELPAPGSSPLLRVTPG
jgi:hypothetical protein